MSATREYREFFTRTSKLNVGAKKDQELGFPTTTIVTDANGVQKTVSNRFVDTGCPTEEVYDKLFESVATHLNTESTATATQQGLVSKPTTAELTAHTATDSDGFALTVDPSTAAKRTVKDFTIAEFGHKAPIVNYKVTADYTLDATKNITYLAGSGNVLSITPDMAGNNTLDSITYAAGVSGESYEIYLVNASGSDIYITHKTGALTDYTIKTPKGQNTLFPSGSFAKLIASHVNKGWYIVWISSAIDSITPVGIVSPFMGTVAPAGWLLCNGNSISNVGDGGTHEGITYQALFEMLKVVAPNTGAEVWGTDVVLLPNLAGRFLVGLNAADPDFTPIGDVGGAKTVTLDATMIPAHTHDTTVANHTHDTTIADHTHDTTIPAHAHTVDLSAALGADPAFVAEGGATAGATAPTDTHAGSTETSTAAGAATNTSTAAGGFTQASTSIGGGLAHQNLPPFYTVNYIIKY